MSDITATAAVCATTGAIAAPFCAAFGFDLNLLVGGIVGGLIGCVIAQTLLPERSDTSFRRVLSMMIGSVLLAGILTLVLSPWVIRQLSLAEVPPGAVRLTLGAIIGAFAQPIAIKGQAKLMSWLDRAGEKKESTP
jgi:uncharacterized membrane protein YeaQ/YmgE (transglycosylase-associated protein family)